MGMPNASWYRKLINWESVKKITDSSLVKSTSWIIVVVVPILSWLIVSVYRNTGVMLGEKCAPICLPWSLYASFIAALTAILAGFVYAIGSPHQIKNYKSKNDFVAKELEKYTEDNNKIQKYSRIILDSNPEIKEQVGSSLDSKSGIESYFKENPSIFHAIIMKEYIKEPTSNDMREVTYFIDEAEDKKVLDAKRKIISIGGELIYISSMKNKWILIDLSMLLYLFSIFFIMMIFLYHTLLVLDAADISTFVKAIFPENLVERLQ